MIKISGRENTVKIQNYLFKKWIKDQFIHPITEENLENAVALWKSRGLKPNTIRALVSLTKKYSIQNGSPIKVTHRIQLGQANMIQPTKALSKSQAHQILDFVQKNSTHSEYLTISLGYHAGLRKGEVFGLQWGDFDRLNRRLYIQRSYDGPTKNGKNRVVPLSDSLYSLLLWNSVLATGQKVIPIPFNPGPLLQRACEYASIPKITFHGLRHTFATLALNGGKTIKEVQAMLGHSKASTTIDIYWNHLPVDTQVDFT